MIAMISGRSLATRPGTAMVRSEPVIGERDAWRGAVGYAGRAARQVLDLGAGAWQIGLQYAAAVPITVTDWPVATLLIVSSPRSTDVAESTV